MSCRRIAVRIPRNSMNFPFVLPRRKKILVLHLRCRGYQLTVLNPFGGDEFAGNLMNFVGAAANHDYLQTIMFVQVNVQAGVDSNFGFVLHIGQKVA